MVTMVTPFWFYIFCPNKVKWSFPEHSSFELMKEVWHVDKVILIHCFGTSFCHLTVEEAKATMSPPLLSSTLKPCWAILIRHPSKEWLYLFCLQDVPLTKPLTSQIKITLNIPLNPLHHALNPNAKSPARLPLCQVTLCSDTLHVRLIFPSEMLRPSAPRVSREERRGKRNMGKRSGKGGKAINLRSLFWYFPLKG